MGELFSSGPFQPSSRNPETTIATYTVPSKFFHRVVSNSAGQHDESNAATLPTSPSVTPAPVTPSITTANRGPARPSTVQDRTARFSVTASGTAPRVNFMLRMGVVSIGPSASSRTPVPLATDPAPAVHLRGSATFSRQHDEQRLPHSHSTCRTFDSFDHPHHSNRQARRHSATDVQTFSSTASRHSPGYNFISGSRMGGVVSQRPSASYTTPTTISPRDNRPAKNVSHRRVSNLSRQHDEHLCHTHINAAL